MRIQLLVSVILCVVAQSSCTVEDPARNNSFRIINKPAKDQPNNWACGGGPTTIQRGETRELTSPNYPQQYPPNARCYWFFNSPDVTTEIVLRCTLFRLAPVQLCNKFEDFLLVENSENTAAWFCGGLGPQNIPGATLRVTFWSNNQDSRRGFQCNVSGVPVPGVIVSNSGSVGGGSSGGSIGNAVAYPGQPSENVGPSNSNRRCRCGQINKSRNRKRQLRESFPKYEKQDNVQKKENGSIDIPKHKLKYFLEDSKIAEIENDTLDYSQILSSGKSFDTLPSTRIVKGTTISIHEFPWLALLEYPHLRGVHCAGSLISSRYILTAAHCTDHYLGSLAVVLGEHDRYSTHDTPYTLRVRASNVIVHANFNATTNDNDIALVELDEELNLDQLAPFIAPICPPNPAHHYERETAFIVGWGTTREDDLEGSRVPLVATVSTLPGSQCRALYHPHPITRNMICADGMGADTCQNDSGGPLMAVYRQNRYVLAGIVSWGVGCGRPRSPGVYTRVGNYLQWIQDNTRGATICPPLKV